MVMLADLAPRTRVIVKANSRFRKDVEGVVSEEKPSSKNPGQVPVYIMAGRNTGVYWYKPEQLTPIKDASPVKGNTPPDPIPYPQGTLLQITSTGIEIGQAMEWWLKVAVATGESELHGTSRSHRTVIRAIDPTTGELVSHSWRTECLKPIPSGEEVEAVEQLLAAIDQESQISPSVEILPLSRQSGSESDPFQVSDWVTNGTQVGVVDALEITPSLEPQVWVEWMDGGESRCPTLEQPVNLQVLEPNWDCGYRRGSQALLNDLVVTVVGFVWGQGSPKPMVETDSRVLICTNFECLLPIEVIASSSTFELTTVELLEELSFDEAQERQRLERKVERAFYEAGCALRQLRDLRLYRSTHKTFEAYCQDRFGFSRQSASYLIRSAGVYENLSTNGCQILPNNERQVRPLTVLESTEQVEAWEQAVEQAGGKVPSARVVKGIVDRSIKAKNRFSAKDFCLPGDAFTLCHLQDSERRYNGCWCIAIKLFDFSIMVDTALGSLQVKPENLARVDYPGINEKLTTVLKRIHSLDDLVKQEESAKAILNSLSKKLYLTAFDERLLDCMEQHFCATNSVDSSS
ncbi:hypothetical protein C7B64_11510 [Merismopedia glauca CCAP 1448/3]|uniref:Uncharacterized protein n=2 Tax=Merismopedia TaxID=53402 RepID=A0A2T1C3D0_9CYAN|nr:hypothetical protein C7B64_11510 [Merismopedia glauca CCAP 1448/3]